MICPICRKPAEPSNPDFPFCGERCRLIDLGKWASEEYRIPVEQLPTEDSDE